LIATVALALLLLLTLLGPGAPASPNPGSLLTPRIDGSGSVAQSLGTGGAQALFPFTPVVERAQGNLQSLWPVIDVVMKYAPDEQIARRAIIGQIYASSSGNIDITIANSGLEANPAPDKLESIETLYQGMADGEQRPRGISGASAMQLIRSLNTTGAERRQHEDNAMMGFAAAAAEAGDTWQIIYNRGLAQMAVGNYADARENFEQVIELAEKDLNLLPRFWAGLAALRNGDPGEAISILTPAVEQQAPPGGNEAFRDLYLTTSRLSREALADAYWANRDPARAYQIYLDALRRENIDTTTGPYIKWVRLALEQRAYEKLAADMASLINSSATMRDDPRIHHDRARLLTMLGRTDEALQEYSKAAELGDNDAALLVSHGQALESRGDLNGALVKAQEAIQMLGFDPATADLTSVARVATSPLPSLQERDAAQQLLDANLLRARVFGRQGRQSDVATLVGNMTQQAEQLPVEQAGLLHLYAAFAYEAAGIAQEASASYQAAWDKLKGTAPVANASTEQKPGRAAALAGLARTTALINGPAAGIEVLKSNGYDPVQIAQNVATDPDAPDLLYQGSLLLDQTGQKAEAANALRVSTVVRNLQDERKLTGVGRPLWTANGAPVPAEALLQAANAQRELAQGSGNERLAELRYKQALGLAPALAPAWNNLGVLYTERGQPDRAQVYLEGAGRVSPSYALGQHNLAAFSYKQGFGDYFTAEGAQGEAVKSAGASSLNRGYGLNYDERGQLPTTAAPPSDLMVRLPAIFILVLLLLHTLVPRDRVVNRALVPGEGPLGKLANRVDAAISGAVPALFTAQRGSSALLRTLIVPAIVGMIGLAWSAARGSFDVAIVFLPVALLCALIAFGANELAQYLAARGAGRETLHNNRPTGVLLALLSVPFGAPYGWQITTRLAPAPVPARGHRAHTGEDHEGEYAEELETGVVPSGVSRLGLSGGARILFAGLLANMALALLFGLVYWLTGWPSIRLALFATVLVLAFTSVSEAPADGWPLYRRNPALWLAIFVAAATVAVLLAGGFI
jgi:tetratricopeptide (TPR) repeat protein